MSAFIFVVFHFFHLFACFSSYLSSPFSRSRARNAMCDDAPVICKRFGSGRFVCEAYFFHLNSAQRNIFEEREKKSIYISFAFFSDFSPSLYRSLDDVGGVCISLEIHNNTLVTQFFCSAAYTRHIQTCS